LVILPILLHSRPVPFWFNLIFSPFFFFGFPRSPVQSESPFFFFSPSLWLAIRMCTPPTPPPPSSAFFSSSWEAHLPLQIVFFGWDKTLNANSFSFPSPPVPPLPRTTSPHHISYSSKSPVERGSFFVIQERSFFDSLPPPFFTPPSHKRCSFQALQFLPPPRDLFFVYHQFWWSLTCEFLPYFFTNFSVFEKISSVVLGKACPPPPCRFQQQVWSIIYPPNIFPPFYMGSSWF